MFSHQMTTSYKMQLAALLASLRSSQRALVAAGWKKPL